MNTASLQVKSVTYRNFNLCPHCVVRGQLGLLSRLREGIPMISRSDGKLFNLLLADRPLSYPAEKQSAASAKLSICFWYSHAWNLQKTSSTVVILPGTSLSKAALFRQIDAVADLLAERLSDSGFGYIAGMCEFVRGSLVEVAY